MHIAIMIDHRRFNDERAWFNRTVVGLVSAGVQVTRIVPEEDPDDQCVSLTASVLLEQSIMPWARKSRLESLADQLKSAGVSLIHAMGRSVWHHAVEVGSLADCPVVLDIWAARDVRHVARLSRSATVSGVFSPTTGLTELLKKHINPSLVCTIPIGVHLSEERKNILGDSNLAENTTDSLHPVAVLAGAEARLEHLNEIIDGFAALHATYPGCMLFADIDPAISSKVWLRAQKRGILEAFSMIPSVNRHRRLVMKADILLMPAPTGRSSSFPLEAMAGLMIPIMALDETVSQPTDPKTARLLDQPTAEDWCRVLREILENPEQSRQMATAARDWVAREHRMSSQVSDSYDAYEMVLTGGTVQLRKKHA